MARYNLMKRKDGDSGVQNPKVIALSVLSVHALPHPLFFAKEFGFA
jgi:hypothetical protein